MMVAHLGIADESRLITRVRAAAGDISAALGHETGPRAVDKPPRKQSAE